MALQILDDLTSLGVKDIFNLYSQVNAAKVSQGVVDTQNYIDKRKAEAELYNAQARNLPQTSGAASFLNAKTLATVGVLGVLGFVAYKLLK